MKLARFGDDRIGIVRDDVIVDVTEIAGAARANGRRSR